MATQADTTNETRSHASSMTQLQTMLGAITPEQLAGPLLGARDADGRCVILGTLTEDMRRLYITVAQLKEAQNAEIEELKELADRDDIDEKMERRGDELCASIASRRQLHGIASQMLQHDISTAFPAPDGNLCPGHVFSDGTVGVHEMPPGLDIVFSLLEMMGGFGRRRR